MSTELLLLAEKAGELLKKTGQQLAAAESCTGGGLAYWLTAIPGSSAWFERGLVTYSNQAKMELLGVKAETLKQYGAVSEETAKEMALGVLTHTPADISIAITGIAGPDGGSLEKPVGTVWIAWAKRDQELITHIEVYKGDRQTIRQAVMIKALETLITKVSAD